MQVRCGNSGIETNGAPRIRSPLIIVLRRLNRSASAPATGPSSSAGSSVTRNTPPTAELAATPPRVRLGARAASARIDSQSPRLDRDSAIQRYRNGLIDSTDRSENHTSEPHSPHHLLSPLLL